MFFKIDVLKNFANFKRKATVLEFLFNKVARPKACNFIKNRLQHRYFPIIFVNFLRTSLFTEIINNLLSTNKDSYVLKTVTYQQVLNEINSIRNDYSTGCDNLPINLLKPLAETIVFPMTTIINDCIRKCIFPKQWKVAKVCPIPKVHNPSQSKDYRPISILPIFSNILERVIMKQ